MIRQMNTYMMKKQLQLQMKATEFVESYLYPEERGFNRWIIVDKDTNQPIGTCGFHCWDRRNNTAEIGYDLWHECWGKGYMKEALTTVLESGFHNMGLNRINAFVTLENINSIKLLEKLGFKNEGIYRDKHLFRGKYYDHYTFSLLKREWNQNYN